MESYGPICFTRFAADGGVPPTKNSAPRNGTSVTNHGPEGPDEPARLALLRGKFWRPGQELKVGFQGGSPWQKIDQRHSDSSIRSVILHEFGHALGAIHEHQSPYANISWDKSKVYSDLGGPPNNWDQETIDHNIFRKYPLEATQTSDFDKNSIMIYAIPDAWVTDRKRVRGNDELSEWDKAYIKFCYPSKDFNAGHFDTLEIHPSDEPLERTEKRIYFHRRQDVAPTIPVGITSLNMSKDANIRVGASATNQTLDHFTAVLHSWADTKLYAASMAFLEVDDARFGYLQTGEYTTMESCPWDKPQTTQSRRIRFAKPFENPPHVVVWLRSLDMDLSKDFRVKTYTSEVDKNGFTIHIDTWSDSILWSAAATWLAYPANQPMVTSGRFSTSGVGAQAENTGVLKFSEAFSKPPKATFAIDELDLDCKANLRLGSSIQSATKEGFSWRLWSWGDSVMHKSAASSFAWAEDD